MAKKKKINTILIIVIIVVFIIVARESGFLGAADVPIDVTVQYMPDTFSMASGCSGEIKLAPNSGYDLEICLNDGISDYGCKTYTSGEYGTGNILSTVESPITAGNYRLKLHWKRIKYIDMDNTGLNNQYDKGESSIGVSYSRCEYTQLPKGYYGTNAISNNDCTLSGSFEYNIVCRDSVGCTVWENPGCTGASFDGSRAFLGKKESRRIYEGFVRSGGTDITGLCFQSESAKEDPSTVCQTWGTLGYHSILIDCVEGIEDSFPSNLCTYAGDNIEYTDYFTIGTSSGTTSVSLTENKISSTGTINFEIVGDCSTLRTTLGTAITSWIAGGSRAVLGTAINNWVGC